MCSDRIPVFRDQLLHYQPTLIAAKGRKQASVAAILRCVDSRPELLFIERAVSPNDQWSGQIAFPGGRVERDDADVRAAAIRETREETDIVLTTEKSLGRLDDLQGSNRNRMMDLVISCFVFECLDDPLITPNYEVADAFWVGLDVLTDAANQFDYQMSYRPEPYPAVRIGTDARGDERVLWGLTWRFVQGLLAIIRT